MFSITELITYSIIAFLVLILLMVFMLVYAKSKLVSSGAVKIKINGESEIEVGAGSTLLTTLGNSKIFLPSACGGGGTWILTWPIYFSASNAQPWRNQCVIRKGQSGI